jgi:hypothetical protein
MSRQLELSKPLARAEEFIRLESDAPEVPVAVRLDDRAVALEGIMTYLNKANQVRGGRKQMAAGGGKLRERYGLHAIDVQRGAERSRDELIGLFRSGISTLIAEEALRAGGMDEADIEIERVSLQAALNRQFGVGRARAEDRARVVRQAKKTATIK